MKPEDIRYNTGLDAQYACELKEVTNDEEFKLFLEKWIYWLDEDAKTLRSWAEIGPLIAECRNGDIEPSKKHDSAMLLLMPSKIFTISMYCIKCNTMWGFTYLKLRETGKINY